MFCWRYSIMLTMAACLWGAEHGGVIVWNGQPLPGATVSASRAGETFTAWSDEQGRYAFRNLPPGAWTVKVEMFGFAEQSRETDIGEETSEVEWRLELKPAPAEADAAGAPVTPAANGFRDLDIQEIDGDLAGLELLPPAPPDSINELSASEAFLVSGSLSRGLIDPPPDDATFQSPETTLVQMLAQQAGRSAEDNLDASLPPAPEAAGRKAGAAGGRGPAMGGVPGMAAGAKGKAGAKAGAMSRKAAAGARMARARAQGKNFGNKRGKKKSAIRGSVNFALQNSALDAKPYSLSGQSIAKPAYARTRFGLILGGPVRLPWMPETQRSVFTLNYTGVLSRNPYSSVATLPTALERAGDFSRSVTRMPVTIHDPAGRQPFPGNIVPASRVHRTSSGLLEWIPLPNLDGQVQNYHYLTSVNQNTHQFSVRFNQAASRQDRLALSFNLQNRDGENAQLFGFRDDADTRGMNADLSWTRNLGSRTIHAAKLSFNRNRNQTMPYFAHGRDIAAELGILGTARDSINFGPPNLSFTNFGGLSDASPVLRRDQSAAVTDSLTVVRGPHNVSFGAEYRRNQLNSRTDQNARGSFTFSGLMTSGLDRGNQPLPGTGFDFADFLLGYPQSSSIRFGSANNYFRERVYSVFGQDDWRLRPNVTLNFGLRYEYFTPYREKFGRMANLDIAPGFTGAGVVTPGQAGPYSGAFPDALIDPDRNNVSPRIGAAWRPSKNGRTTVRAGYGVYFNGSIYNQFATRLASQPPFANTGRQSTSVGHPLNIQQGFASAPSASITNTYAVDRSYQVGYAQTWNLSIQTELPRALVLEAGYLGTKGTRLDIQRHPNRAAPGSPLTAEQRRQIGNAVGFTFESSEGNSIYHAAQVRLVRRFHKGMAANALYTWSKSIDNASTFGGGGNVVAQNDRDLRSERGLSSFDQRHSLTLFYTISSPVGGAAAPVRARGIHGALLKDWSFSGGVTARSGQPLTARVMGNRADSGGTGVVGNGRADATGQPVSAGGGFFNPSAFGIPPSGRYGNAGRNTVPGPGFLSLNLSLGRSFRLGGERHRMDLRVESTNLTNSVNFRGVGTVVNALNYGLPTAALAMRTMNASVRFRF